ncbi:MAG TPA: DUF2147 domain-containing protein [Pseudolabrys sp.]|nr:DUF2147 domain-containing protein [Pseudolabrys sp.]
MPNRPKPISANPRLLSAACAAWLIANGAVLAQQPPVPAPPDPTGEWVVAKQVARIKIANCDGQMWGVVSWETQPGIDTKNPDPNLRSRPTLGMPILLGMAASKANKWEGQIYNSEDGHTYSASITLLDPNTLRVQGCFLGFLCGGENWTRAESLDPPATATTQRTSTKPPATRKTTGKQPDPTDDTCSRTLGSAGLSHERGLK